MVLLHVTGQDSAEAIFFVQACRQGPPLLSSPLPSQMLLRFQTAALTRCWLTPNRSWKTSDESEPSKRYQIPMGSQSFIWLTLNVRSAKWCTRYIAN